MAGSALRAGDNARMKIWLSLMAAMPVVAAVIWANDSITMQGERTVYTVQCQGAWQGQHCDGRLLASDRFRFRALSARGEVLFWTLGVNEPSGKFTDCAIEDGRNWTCRPTAEGPRSIAFQMVHGFPAPDKTGLAKPFHSVGKLRWWFLQWGLPAGSDAHT